MISIKEILDEKYKNVDFEIILKDKLIQVSNDLYVACNGHLFIKEENGFKKCEQEIENVYRMLYTDEIYRRQNFLKGLIDMYKVAVLLERKLG